MLTNMAKLREISRKFMLKTRGGREPFVPYFERHIKAIITSEQDSLQRRPLKQVNGDQEEKAVVKDDDSSSSSSKFGVVDDVALEASCNLLSVSTLGLANAVCPASRIIKSQEFGRQIAHLRNLKRQITMLTTCAQEARGKLEQRLDDGDVTRGDGNNYLQILLKSYFMQVDGTLTNLTKLSRYIGKLEDHIFFQIENCRNDLIRRLMNLIVGAVYFTIFLYVVLTYYPNIWNKYPQLDDIFTGIYAFSLGFWACSYL